MKYKIQTNGKLFRVQYEDGSYLLDDNGTTPALFGSIEAAEYIASKKYKDDIKGPWVDCTEEE